MRNKFGKNNGKVKKQESINISEEYKMESNKKGNGSFIKDSNTTRQDYDTKVFSNPSALRTSNVYKQQSFTKYALQYYLENTFKWDYFLVVTFGNRPQKVDVDKTLIASHLRLERSILGNNKLTTININDRSKWVAIPEYGDCGKQLHYNIFIKLEIKPEIKTYKNEWDSLRQTFKNMYRELSKELGERIEFELRDRAYSIRTYGTIDRVINYSTKEMRMSNIQKNGVDTFEQTYFSWKDFPQSPINSRTPKKIKKLDTKMRPKVGALDKFMS